MKPVYDQIGEGYSKHRCADRRIVKTLADVLGMSPPATIADIGAGTGNYSRALADLGFQIEAVEPSETMRCQAVSHTAVRWSNGTAEQVPLSDDSVDAVVCILAAHHFSSVSSAVKEMARICKSGPIVWFTFDPRKGNSPWLADYFPTIWNAAFSAFPPLDDVCSQLAADTSGQVEVLPFLIPHDLDDCFVAAGWRRPEMYLDADVRACMSAFALTDVEVVNEGLLRLQSDLATGKWKSSHADLLNQDTVDWGYRFLKATPGLAKKALHSDAASRTGDA
jgi:ubiquinone/menaquinone biosynthesis C-methylase UbiE